MARQDWKEPLYGLWERYTLIISILLFILVYYLWMRFIIPLLKKKEPFFGRSVVGSTISDNDAKLYASYLHEAMGGLGTTDSMMDFVFDKISGNKANYNKIYNFFGRKAYSYFGDPWGIFAITNDFLDLDQWLNYELSGSELKKWNFFIS
ncbi:MAG: hypothetical protein FWF54_00605 [Candidatus Azobacteroides sp.]|nr:hypothetical protein [Candidatus Azobacteroides sp.]